MRRSPVKRSTNSKSRKDGAEPRRTHQGRMDKAAKSSQLTSGGQPGRRRFLHWIAGVLVLLVVAGAVAGPIMSHVEQPEYKIEESDGSFQVRSYEPMIAAEAVVDGERKTAINEGFRLIAAFIFGANKPNAKIAIVRRQAL